jgi:tellurite resistance protein TerC
VLIFVGAKMLLADVYGVPIGLSLGFITAVIGASIVASLAVPAPSEGPAAEE